jgi:hypothetical protein
MDKSCSVHKFECLEMHQRIHTTLLFPAGTPEDLAKRCLFSVRIKYKIYSITKIQNVRYSILCYFHIAEKCVMVFTHAWCPNCNLGNTSV